MSPFKTLIIILLVIAFVYGLFTTIARRDRAIAQGAQNYEACVLSEYNTTPAAWYEEHGVYPTCGK